MGVHHAWGRTYKDLYQRYHAMQGKNLRWQNGFDCQGLWVEVEVEKELGFKTKRDIEAFGLENFVKLCKARVLNYAAVQTEQSVRLGYWMDWNSPAELRRLSALMKEDPQQEVTIQGAGRANHRHRGAGRGHVGPGGRGRFLLHLQQRKQLHDLALPQDVPRQRLALQGRDVMPWCARCGTGISQHEIVTDGYFEVTHDSVFVKFPLVRSLSRKEALLVWTTTPWTLTSNVAAAVGPELTYVKVQHEDGWTYYLAEEAPSKTASSVILRWWTG
jgi:isoleucyl-tRNA synthetase